MGPNCAKALGRLTLFGHDQLDYSIGNMDEKGDDYDTVGGD